MTALKLCPRCKLAAARRKGAYCYSCNRQYLRERARRQPRLKEMADAYRPKEQR